MEFRSKNKTGTYFFSGFGSLICIIATHLEYITIRGFFNAGGKDFSGLFLSLFLVGLFFLIPGLIMFKLIPNSIKIDGGKFHLNYLFNINLSYKSLAKIGTYRISLDNSFIIVRGWPFGLILINPNFYTDSRKLEGVLLRPQNGNPLL